MQLYLKNLSKMCAKIKRGYSLIGPLLQPTVVATDQQLGVSALLKGRLVDVRLGKGECFSNFNLSRLLWRFKSSHSVVITHFPRHKAALYELTKLTASRPPILVFKFVPNI